MSQPVASGADLARTALRAARKAASSRGDTPAKRPAATLRRADRHGPGPREPQPIAEVFLALVAAHGWTLGTAGGGLRDHWPTIVGPDAAAHWHLAGYDPTTRRLRVTADSPAWAAQLRLHHRRIVSALHQLRPGTVTAIDVRVGPAPAPQADQDVDERPAPRRAPAPLARPPLADHTVYQELRRELREQALVRQAALDEAAARAEAILTRHYNRLREPDHLHRAALEDVPVSGTDEHDRQQRARHRAALAVSRATRAGAVPLCPTRPPKPLSGAA
ncbi:DciA family protein [Kitasatospora sp. NPDC002551]|uniref:DciA family protein n=1 Tax=Kitasatospora sp. NPDC002551 TaxID=3154539 RepID=UPI00332BEDEF